MGRTYFKYPGYTLQEQALDQRRHMTEPERKLWFCFLKDQAPRFEAQKVIGPYIVDFFCRERRMIIELDGESHTETVAHDREREAFLRQQGYAVLHITNEQIRTEFEAVCETIQKRTIHMKTVTIYTDGACSGNPGPGGWGAILSFNGAEKELSGGEARTTNNRMELTGVIRALQALKEPCVVELYSDSKYVIDALSKGWVWGWKKKGWVKSDKKPALNVDLWEQMLPLVATHEMHYHWVKGHAENEKNNRCDELAVAESRKYK